MPRPQTFDHLRKKTPLERVVRVPLSDEAVEAFKVASDELGRAQLTGQGIKKAQDAYDEARKALDSETAVLRFRSLGRRRYEELLRDHPPTEDQDKEHRERAGGPAPYNWETFSVALIAASCIEPELTEDEVQVLSEEWNSAEYLELWMAALEVNTQRRVVELGKAWNGTAG